MASRNSRGRVLLLAARDDPHGVIRQRPLEAERLVGGSAEPEVEFADRLLALGDAVKVAHGSKRDHFESNRAYYGDARMTTVTVRPQDNSIRVTFPTETRIRMGFEVGQDLTLIELADGVKLVKRNVKLERQMALAHDVVREQADVLQELAKR